MIRGLRTEDRGQTVVYRMAARAERLRGKAATKPLSSVLCPLSSDRGFTLIEMIMVIVITGIIGAIVAVFIEAPIKQYTDVARRADMTDIADTALRRISRDVRLALPNSVRVSGEISGAGSCDGSEACFLEYLPTLVGARYRAIADAMDNVCPDTSVNDDILSFSAADTCFEILGTMLPLPDVGHQVVVYNMGNTGADAYAGNTLATHNRRAINTVGANNLRIDSVNALPHDSPGHRFHVISTPVSYACDGAGTLWRYSGYAIQAEQTSVDTIAELEALAPVKAKLATNVSSCRFTYDPLVVVSARNGLVTMHLAIQESNLDGQVETVTLYSAAHLSNVP